MQLTKCYLQNRYNLIKGTKMKKLGTGNYTERQKLHFESMKNWYDKNRHLITSSKNVIEVDFKNKKIIKGATRHVKKLINNKAA